MTMNEIKDILDKHELPKDMVSSFLIRRIGGKEESIFKNVWLVQSFATYIMIIGNLYHMHPAHLGFVSHVANIFCKLYSVK